MLHLGPREVVDVELVQSVVGVLTVPPSINVQVMICQNTVGIRAGGGGGEEGDPLLSYTLPALSRQIVAYVCMQNDIHCCYDNFASLTSIQEADILGQVNYV